MEYECPTCRRGCRTRPEFVEHIKWLQDGNQVKDILTRLGDVLGRLEGDKRKEEEEIE